MKFKKPPEPTTEQIMAKCPEKIEKSKIRLNKRGEVGNGRSKAKQAVHRSGWHSEEDRIRVASVYAVTGSAVSTEKITGISANLIRQWKIQPWWPQIMERIRQEHNDEVDVKISKIIDTTLEKVQDRLENGDFTVTPSGKIIQAPMKGKEIAVVASIMFDKRDMIRKKEKSHIAEQSTQQVLKQLLEEFRKFSGQKTVEGVVVDKEITDVEVVEQENSGGESPTG